MALFDEYKTSKDPAKRERAENWGIAIGLNAAEGLAVSPHLIELARKNIEGEITIAEVNARLAERYPTKPTSYTTYTIIDGEVPDDPVARRIMMAAIDTAKPKNATVKPKSDTVKTKK